ncbi:MAG: VapC toxin family PIN domain ribonuclease [Pseudonocardiaceae bacterium]
MRILLDTSVILDLAEIELGVQESAEPAASAVSVAELAFGLDIDDPIERRGCGAVPRRAQAVRRVDLRRPSRRDLRHHGRRNRRAGRNPRPRRMDLQIHSIPLITVDVDGFTGLERLLDVVVV